MPGYSYTALRPAPSPEMVAAEKRSGMHICSIVDPAEPECSHGGGSKVQIVSPDEKTVWG